jgi:L-galactose dehydrogenase/L-glyceraldehyde 3-phosphate reductase
MRYRDLGSTGLKISEIVFGAGAQGGIVFRGDRETRLEAVNRALYHGINWIDTAAQYGDGQSEENLGWILRELDAHPHISTKVRIELSHADDITGEIQRSMEASLTRLQMESVDLFQLHSVVTNERGTQRGSISLDDVLGQGGVVAGFQKLRDQGLARWFGFTGFGDTDCLQRMITSGHFHAVQVYYNLLNPSAGRPVPPAFSAQDYGNLIGLCAAHGVGVLNIRPLAAGAVVGQPPAGSNVLSPGSSGAADLERTQQLARVLGEPVGQMAKTAIRFGLSNPGVSAVLVGFAQLEHIDEAVAAAALGPLPPEVLDKLDRLYKTDFGAL